MNQKNKKYILAVPILIFSLYGLYRFISYPRLSINKDDLVEEVIDKTTYLRPAQWYKHDIPNTKLSVSQYGSSPAKNSKSLAIIQVTQAPPSPALINSSDETYEAVRAAIVNDSNLKQAYITGPLAKLGCTSPVDIAAEPHRSSIQSLTGIAHITTSCSNIFTKVLFVSYFYVSKEDGRLRSISVLTHQPIWDKNKATFMQILTSIRDTDSNENIPTQRS